MGERGPRGPFGPKDENRKMLLDRAFYLIECMEDNEIEHLIDVLKLYGERQ